MEHKSEGVCRFCLKKFSGAGMGRHLLTCKTRKEKNKLEFKGRKKYKIYHLKISGSKWYWLHIDIPASATLMDLDNFLRGIWLECCGHLSAFTIKDVRYEDARLQKEYLPRLIPRVVRDDQSIHFEFGFDVEGRP